MERTDRFTFMPGDIIPITDPERLERMYEQGLPRPLPDEENEWIAEQWAKRWRKEPRLTTFQLQREYEQLKAEGKL